METFPSDFFQRDGLYDRELFKNNSSCSILRSLKYTTNIIKASQAQQKPYVCWCEWCRAMLPKETFPKLTDM